MVKNRIIKGPSLPWLCGSWIYKCPCNQCLSSLMLWARILIRARCTTLCDKVCQWLATDGWFSPGTPVSSTNKTQGRIQDFKLRGAQLNNLRRAEGGAKFVGVFRVKNHDFTPNNHIFSNFRGGPPPPWIRPWIWPPRYNWNIVESGVKHHQTNTILYYVHFLTYVVKGHIIFVLY
jgi:hypothetical protein